MKHTSHRLAHTWFLEVVFVWEIGVHIHVCMTLKELMTIHIKCTHNNRFKSSTAFQFTYITLAMNNMGGFCLISKVHCDYQPVETNVTLGFLKLLIH